MNSNYAARGQAPRCWMFVVLAFLLAADGLGPMRMAAAAGPAPQARVSANVLSHLRDTGKATYWVVLRERADLTSAYAMNEHARGQFVFDELRAVAKRSQARLRSALRTRGGDFTAFWAANVVKVTSDKATLDEVAALPEVDSIEADRVFRIPEPIPAVQEAAVEAVEWNIANIRANDVWSTFGARGEGIVVGSIDTGAQFNHPALVNQYRGNLGGGHFDHNYNWYDPSRVCGNPSLAPCDNNNHGTHTMGTIVGDDGGTNQIGVAPGARWITAKGCESSSCSYAALVAAGQWMLAPTDLDGQNPRPDLRPNLVSNSWGGGSGDTFYQQIVQNWVAAGIFPVFANGNSGPSCGTVGSPGDYPESYGVGAYDSANLIASFSSRGASGFGVTKPNISAPGVNVRSSITGNSYAAYSGTSMATPHVAGVVALMWSAAVSLAGNVTTTRQILDQTAIDAADNSCGGTPSNNNVYGEGRMDAFRAVDQSPRGPTGRLEGMVSDADGLALPGIRVRAVQQGGPSDRTTTTDPSGTYALTLPVGLYDVTVSGFGYLTQTVTAIAVTDGTITVQDFTIQHAPSHRLSGLIRDSQNNPVPNATVTILSTPIAPATTDATGAYQFNSVPEGQYDVKAQAGRCNDPQTRNVIVDVDQTLDFSLPARSDTFGYTCTIIPQSWVAGRTAVSLTGDDSYATVNLPFNFPFYGGSYSSGFVTTNGYISFGALTAAYANTAIPNASVPNLAVYALWDDLYMDASSSLRTDTIGSAPNRQFVVEWSNIAFYGSLAVRLDIEVLLGEDGRIITQYRNLTAGSGQPQGNAATLGLENATGTDAFQYSFNEAVVSEGLAVRYAPPVFTGIMGMVSDANDGLPIAGATVRAIQNGTPVQTVTTPASGVFRMDVPAGPYIVEASAPNYATASVQVAVTEGQPTRQDFALQTARLVVSPTILSFNMNIGQQQTQTVTVSNTGTRPLLWQLSENGGNVAWLSETPTSGTLAPTTSQIVQVTVDATGLNGPYSAILVVSSNAAKQPTAQVSVSASVTAYSQRANAGGPGAYDASSNYWAPDQAYVNGGWGYTNPKSTTMSIRKVIAGTADQALFQDQRLDPGEYRFDVPSGTYQVTLSFAELKQVKAGARVFDVRIEGGLVLTGYDMVARKGAPWIADSYSFTVTVTDGQLNLAFIGRPKLQPPAVNAIWVRQLR